SLVSDGFSPSSSMATRYPLNPNKEAVRWQLLCMCCKMRVTASDALKGHAYFALNGVWHKQHMCCKRCKINVAEIPFCESRTEPGTLMCTDCYMIENNPNCTACDSRLFETAVEADGKLYHRECLRCKACKHQIQNNGQYITDDVGGIYDVDCYHIMILPKDYGCNFGEKPKPSSEKTDENTNA
ncbi:hypothetical protein PMAYCL1PPCAC_21206, partial [Pristionchus mayeri]